MREIKADADIAKVLTMDEARRIASNIAKLPQSLKQSWERLGAFCCFFQLFAVITDASNQGRGPAADNGDYGSPN